MARISKFGPSPKTLPIAADLLYECVSHPERFVEPLSGADTLSLIIACGRMKVIDSELFELLERNFVIDSIDDLVKLVKAMRRLENGKFFKSAVHAFVMGNRESLIGSDLGRVIIPLLKYGTSVDDMHLANSIVNVCLMGVRDRISVVRKDRDLLLSKTVVEVGDVYDIVTLFGAYKRRNTQWSFPESFRDDIVFACKSIVSYELRNMSDLSQLLRIYFSLSELGVFDDWFIRRRLVPSIAHVFKEMPVKSTEHVELIKVMIEQLPFENDMVKELSQLVSIRA
jgi:hypothetical protein